MKNTINTTHIEGYLYEHDLELKVSGPNSKSPGTEFISGTINIATDEALTNIVPIHFTYVTALTSKSKTNHTFTELHNILSGAYGTVMKDGKENAITVKIDSAIGLWEFFSSRSGKEELVSVKRNEGGFIHVNEGKLSDDEKLRSTFTCDMIITGATRIPADEEKMTEEKVIVKGAIFDFRKALLPIELSAVDPNAMIYFESLEASHKDPVFTKVWGRQLSKTVVKLITEESSFGDDNVREVINTHKDFVLTGSSKNAYLWDDKDTILASELAEAMTERQTKLAVMKQRQDEYEASGAKGEKKKTVVTGEFDF